MDWEKARNYTIIFLLILNIILFGINFHRSKESTVTAQRTDTVSEYCKRNNISVECDLPEKYEPMKRVVQKDFSFDLLGMERLFFTNLTGISRTDVKNTVLLTNGLATLKVDGQHITYEDKNFAKTSDRQEALSVANRYVKAIMQSFGGFTLESINETENGREILFFDRINGYPVFGSYVKFLFRNEGGICIDISYYPVTQGGDEVDPVIASDEALYAAVAKIRQKYPEGCRVDSVTQGYFYQNATSEVIAGYRIGVQGEGFYVNAVTGEAY